MKTLKIQTDSDQAISIIENLESLHLIKILKSHDSNKIVGDISTLVGSMKKQTGKEIEEISKSLRNEWE
ncbi:MAG: hypothetical protein SFU91_08265 [Chloroherpetonaceae bacterium]|nr:hypothetical protein [Chloroherpetonaceae bacterium]